MATSPVQSQGNFKISLPAMMSNMSNDQTLIDDAESQTKSIKT